MSKRSTAILIITAAMMSSSAASQDLSGEFIGDIASAPSYVTDAGATSVKVNFTYDTTVPFTTVGPPYFRYDGALAEVTYEFMDAQGNPIDFSLPTPFFFPDGAQQLNLSGSFDYDDNYSYNTINYQLNNTTVMAYFNLDANQQSPLFVPFDNYPQFQEVANEPFSYESTLIIRAPDTQFSAEAWIDIDVHTLRYVGLDADEDGIADTDDLCGASILDETAMFGPFNSGVPNYIDADGCSIMDHYAACEAEEEEAPSSPWGWFQPVYSGPSSCERQVSYSLVDAGVIDYTEARMLRNALNLSSQQGDL
ncbi:hypothetical protein PSI9734_01657 [Pseudidiomarina piscicola]|uniref:Uncharacterized protein n=1 Tax=Pseudidiomarina piscicola TaxID=2614830 RepID=A0A6S6WV41_9GAMM|nr:hypothetical protein [Pseudidiomarina piscicola]CAB0151244.1 hypothetical protein PSI9734_01657 [Pseudidiomarina piscicola]VZT40750.1 hypothetical protein PSI9734_01657 [Pseudomonas aeruginosa]